MATKKSATKKTVEKKPTSFVLRTCAADMTSHSGFVWPAVGEEAVCPDWINNTECGNGLHGWLFGAGDHSCSSYLDDAAKWLVVEVESDSIVMLGGKCKFPRGVVRFVGERKAATDFLLSVEPRAASVAVIGASLTVGDKAAVMVGALGFAESGSRGTSTSGDGGTSTSGDGGTSTSGSRGTSTSGYGGTSTSGYGGTSTSGDGGEIRIRYYDLKAARYRAVVGYIGEDGLEPNVAYRLNDKHKFVKAD